MLLRLHQAWTALQGHLTWGPVTPDLNEGWGRVTAQSAHQETCSCCPSPLPAYPRCEGALSPGRRSLSMTKAVILVNSLTQNSQENTDLPQ